MHVPGVDITQPHNDPKNEEPKRDSNGLFEAFLQDAQLQGAGLLKIAGSLGLETDFSVLTDSATPTPLGVHAGNRKDDVSPSDNGDDKIPESRDRDEDQQSDTSHGATQAAAENAAAHEDPSATLSNLITPAVAAAQTDAKNTDTSTVSPEIAAIAQGPANIAALTTRPSGPESTQKPATVINQSTAPTETVDKTPNVNPLTKNQDASAGKSASVTVTEENAPLHSRPASTLASAAAVSAQTAAQGQTGKGNSLLSEPTATSGNLLLNAAANKGSAQNQPGQQQTGQQSSQSNTPATPPATQPTQPNVAATATPPAAAVASGPAAATSSFGDALTSATGPASSPSAVERPRQVSPKTPAPPPAPPRPLTDQIAVQIRKAVDQGVDKIRIQLRPAELGRVEIKLEIGMDGRVAAHVIAERPETMELLQRDARGLQQALQDAGLRTDSGSLSFNLSGQNNGEDKAASGDAQPGGDKQGPDDGQDETDVADNAEPRRASDSLIDVEV
jgi:flagellar hook-length control protein FliK